MAEHNFRLPEPAHYTRAWHPDAEHDPARSPSTDPPFVFKDADDANLLLQKYGQHLLAPVQPPPSPHPRSAHRLPSKAVSVVATASGMAAEFITFAALASRGDQCLRSCTIPAAPSPTLDVSLRRFGIETTFVPGTDPADCKAALTEDTKAILHRDRGRTLREVAGPEARRGRTRGGYPAGRGRNPCPPRT